MLPCQQNKMENGLLFIQQIAENVLNLLHVYKQSSSPEEIKPEEFCDDDIWCLLLLHHLVCGRGGGKPRSHHSYVITDLFYPQHFGGSVDREQCYQQTMDGCE